MWFAESLAKNPTCADSVPFFFVVDKLSKHGVQPCFVRVQFVIGVCPVGVFLCSAHVFSLPSVVLYVPSGMYIYHSERSLYQVKSALWPPIIYTKRQGRGESVHK